MATLTEINVLIGERGALFDKTKAALLIAAEAVRANGSATALQQAWAKKVYSNPALFAESAYFAVLAANNTSTVAQLQGATDTQVQTAVNNVVAILQL